MKSHRLESGRALALAVALSFATLAPAAFAADLAPVKAQLAAQHDANVKRLQDWIALPSIAAENLGYPAGAEYQAQLLRDAGFQHVEIIPTDGKPGVAWRTLPWQQYGASLGMTLELPRV